MYASLQNDDECCRFNQILPHNKGIYSLALLRYTVRFYVFEFYPLLYVWETSLCALLVHGCGLSCVISPRGLITEVLDAFIVKVGMKKRSVNSRASPTHHMNSPLHGCSGIKTYFEWYWCTPELQESRGARLKRTCPHHSSGLRNELYMVWAAIDTWNKEDIVPQEIL